MSSVTDLELVSTVVMGIIMAGVLVASGYLTVSSSITFVSMVLIGFIAMRAIRGRKWSWR
ncbi:hypothetical protein [Halonotius pteroides]|uniref:Uncharacterized protein n=1 Tax=Halonotius pteroides TaxID=268735 RepID=A0A3A6QLW8_9EURY|nr:hypothetical protein [Halonotius pteroides]RJX48636.1 hypothetical protein DP106_11460 [Halonotius pteroides]